MGSIQPSATVRHWIEGTWQANGDGATTPSLNPSTSEVIGSYPVGGDAEVREAFAAARAALGAWSRSPPALRGEILNKIANDLEGMADRIADQIALNVGMPRKLARMVQTDLPISTFRVAAALTETYPFEHAIGSSRVLMEPVGVVACITPWNYPLHQTVGKLAMAMAAGCTVVLKPSEIAPLCVESLIEATERAGVPPGVFNVVWGDGSTGRLLSESADFDLMSFTGSAVTGALVAQAAAKNLKRSSLELGGKSASVILRGSDLKKAVRSSLSNCFLNSGQTCSAWTRLLVHKEDLAQATQLAKDAAAQFKVGDPFDPQVRMGPLISGRQRDRVLGFIDRGREDGANLVYGGAVPTDLNRGFFVEPTIFTDVDPSSELGQQEVFGPVLSIIAFSNVENAIEIANGTDFGLAGGVWAADIREAEMVARQLKTGQVDLNGARYNSLAPFGGVKKSGYGREMGGFGLAEFLETKSLQF